VRVRAWSIGIAAALMAAAGAISGCGGDSGGFDKNKVLDTERVERAIEASILEKRHLRATVTCPSGIEKKKDVKFHCLATYRSGKTTFLVTEDEKGAVHYVGLKS
jgi:Domain of unknown function (DUF4333)